MDTPKGFLEVKIAINGSNIRFIKALVCETCGAIVYTPHTHTMWHIDLDG